MSVNRNDVPGLDSSELKEVKEKLITACRILDHEGVTDGYGRVHGLPNLHVAGSSLFPTGGWANPTLMILALAMRTADRIAEELDAARPATSAKDALGTAG